MAQTERSSLKGKNITGKKANPRKTSLCKDLSVCKTRAGLLLIGSDLTNE